MASALAVDAMVQGAGHAPSVSHTGVYRVATLDGQRATGVAGMLFLREDRACVLRLSVPLDGGRTLIRLIRGIWWPVEVGIKVLTSDGGYGVWPAGPNSVRVSLPLPPCGSSLDAKAVSLRFVRLR